MVDEGEGPSGRAWVIEALKALAEGGIDSVKVERLARQLGVSKAPFYWRFQDRAALLDAMLDYWKDDLTDALIRKVAVVPKPHDRIEALMALSLEEHVDGLQVSAVEGAIRAWAAQDRTVGAFVASVDDLRVKHIAREPRVLGARGKVAASLAKGIYLALIGLYAARRYTPSLASDEAFAAIVRAALKSVKTDNS